MSLGIGILLPGPADFPAWRAQARRLLAAGIPPEHVDWRVAGEGAGLFRGAPPPEVPGGAGAAVPRAFLELAEIAIRHRDPERFALLYRLLWRLTHGEPALLEVAVDAEVARAGALAKAVRRDAHKMHAFLRFRCLGTPAGPRYIAWFEPDHHIVEAEAGFFIRRFAGLHWSILTPAASAHWDGAALSLGPGGRREEAPPEDATEALWRTYFESIFNPARLKPAAMRAEMPKKYWRNLPETAAIPRLLAAAPGRVAAMVARGATPAAPRRQRSLQPAPPAAGVPPPGPDSLAALWADLLADRGPLARAATQPVGGEGPAGAALMFVGEQPGDAEDLAGRPFVGPAGQLLDRALAEAGVARGDCYLTNAVKHFKYQPVGRRRLHRTPDAGDIAHYRPFLRRELALVAPRLVVAMGATALRALTGQALAVQRVRGTILRAEGGVPVLATVHPAFLLRLPDPAARAAAYAGFVADLRRAWRDGAA